MIIAPKPIKTVQDLTALSAQLQLGIEQVIGSHRGALFGAADQVHFLNLQWTAQGLSCTLEQHKPTHGVSLEVPPAGSLQTLAQLAMDIQQACAHPFGPSGSAAPLMPMEQALDTAQSVLVQNLLWNHLEQWMDRGMFGLLGRTAQQEHARVSAPAASAPLAPDRSVGTPAANTRQQRSAPSRTPCQALGL